MSNSEQDPRERQADQPLMGSGQLKDQAHSFRQSAVSQSKELYERPLAGWKQVLLLILVLGSLVAAVFLLIEDESRRQLLTSAGGMLYQGERADINRLPPPPPKVIQARVVTAETSGISVAGSEEPRGVLFLDQDPVRIRGEEEVPASPAELPRTESNQVAFDLLVTLSDAAAKLSQNGLDELEFSSWRPVKDESPEFWIDLVATRQPEGEELHLIWSVHIENERVTALSQAARDLEASQ